MNKCLIKIIEALQNYYGNVKPGLEYNGLYELSVAVVLSAQTTDKQVNKITPELFKKFPDFAALSSARVLEVEPYIKSTGFYHNKAENIIKLAKAVVLDKNGNLPDTMEELTTLPGIGRKSANVILTQGFGKPGFAVDTHVIRLARRLGISDSGRPEVIEKIVNESLPKEYWYTAHLMLVHHGRNICKARNPKCEECPISHLCISSDKTF